MTEVVEDPKTFSTTALPNLRDLEELLKTETVWVRIKDGKRAGTIAKVVEVVSWSGSIKIKAAARRQWTIRITECEMLVGYTGDMVFVENTNYAPVVLDFLNRPIKLGASVAYCRAAGRSSAQMIVGSVKEITENGTVYIQPIKVGGSVISKDTYYRASRNGLIQATSDRVLVIDDTTLDEMMLMKLVHG